MQRTVTIVDKAEGRRFHKTLLILMTILFLMIAVATFGSVRLKDNDIRGEQWRSTENAVPKVDIVSSQAISVIGGSVTGAEAGRVIINDDGTSFSAPAVLGSGGQFTINLSLEGS